MEKEQKKIKKCFLKKDLPLLKINSLKNNSTLSNKLKNKQKRKNFLKKKKTMNNFINIILVQLLKN